MKMRNEHYTQFKMVFKIIRYPKVQRSHETSVSQKQVNSREAVTLGHVLLMDAQNKLR